MTGDYDHRWLLPNKMKKKQVKKTTMKRTRVFLLETFFYNRHRVSVGKRHCCCLPANCVQTFSFEISTMFVLNKQRIIIVIPWSVGFLT